MSTKLTLKILRSAQLDDRQVFKDWPIKILRQNGGRVVYDFSVGGGGKVGKALIDYIFTLIIEDNISLK